MLLAIPGFATQCDEHGNNDESNCNKQFPILYCVPRKRTADSKFKYAEYVCFFSKSSSYARSRIFSQELTGRLERRFSFAGTRSAYTHETPEILWATRVPIGVGNIPDQ